MKSRTRMHMPSRKNVGLGNERDAEFETLENLVDELAKPKPQEERIRSYMRQVGLEYTDDPIEQLNCVLRALETKEI